MRTRLAGGRASHRQGWGLPPVASQPLPTPVDLTWILVNPNEHSPSWASPTTRTLTELDQPWRGWDGARNANELPLDVDVDNIIGAGVATDRNLVVQVNGGGHGKRQAHIIGTVRIRFLLISVGCTLVILRPYVDADMCYVCARE